MKSCLFANQGCKPRCGLTGLVDQLRDGGPVTSWPVVFKFTRLASAFPVVSGGTYRSTEEVSRTDREDASMVQSTELSPPEPTSVRNIAPGDEDDDDGQLDTAARFTVLHILTSPYARNGEGNEEETVEGGAESGGNGQLTACDEDDDDVVDDDADTEDELDRSLFVYGTADDEKEHVYEGNRWPEPVTC
jgi:hypothetical protein